AGWNTTVGDRDDVKIAGRVGWCTGVATHIERAVNIDGCRAGKCKVRTGRHVKVIDVVVAPGRGCHLVLAHLYAVDIHDAIWQQGVIICGRVGSGVSVRKRYTYVSGVLEP